MNNQIANIKFSNTHREQIWINDKLKLAFLCIPKVASSGIRKQFKFTKICTIGKLPKDYKVFSIIRDPIKRFVSAYIEVIQDCKNYPGGRFKHNLNITNDKIKFLENLINDKSIDKYKKFEIYIEKIEKEWNFFEPHCIPQIIYLTDKNNNFHNNLMIFKLETELNELEKILNSKIKKGNECENNPLKNDLLKYINENKNIKEKIEKLYNLDIQIYNKSKIN
jgi:hypothetical protein